MEAIGSLNISGILRTTRNYNSEDRVVHSHPRDRTVDFSSLSLPIEDTCMTCPKRCLRQRIHRTTEHGLSGLCRVGNENIEIGTGFSVHKFIVSAVQIVIECRI
jgi:hypothetical protein